METMHKVKAGIMQVLGFVIIALFAFMTLIGTYQIVTRYFFNRPSTVSEELLTYAFTWMALLASAYVFGKRDHMRMGFLADKLIGAPRKYLEITIDLLTFLLAAVVMVYGGISITKLTMIQKTASLQVPMAYVYVIVPVTGVLIMIFSLMNAIGNLRRRERFGYDDRSCLRADYFSASCDYALSWSTNRSSSGCFFHRSDPSGA